MTLCSPSRVFSGHSELSPDRGDEIWEFVSRPPLSIGRSHFMCLSVLKLCGHRLRWLPSAVGDLQTLVNLTLSQNQLTTLPNTMGNLTHLKILCLQHNQIVELPVGLRQLCRLESLDLGHNRLADFSGEVATGLISLKEVNLSYNRLSTLPPEVDRWVNLIEMDLACNRLRELPEGVGGWQCLQQLSLEENELTGLPPDIEGWTSLEHLFLDNNPLGQLPTRVAALPHLSFLSLSETGLRRLPSDFGCHLGRLQSLWLAHNELRSLPPTIALTPLSTLRLTSNTIGQLPLSLMDNPRLVIVDVTGTNIPEEDIRCILAHSRAVKQYGSSASLLPERLWAWSCRSERPLSDAHRAALCALTEEERISIYEWLRRLAYIRDCESAQREVATTVCDMLRTVVEDAAFRADYLAQISANLVECEDRAAMAFSELYAAWRLVILRERPLEEKKEVLMQIANTLALRAVVAPYAVTMSAVDAECFLLYALRLQARGMKLLSPIRETRYAEMMGLHPELSVETAEERTRAQSDAHLMSLPYLDCVIAEDSAFAARLEHALESYTVALANLESRTDQEYRVRSAEIMERRAAAKQALVLDWMRSSHST